MKILVIGSGGREHALCFRLSKSPRVEKIYCAPGNGGISQHAECVTLDDFPTIANFCKNQAIDLVVVGPEQYLVDGLADFLRAENIVVFGPSQKAAQLEGSKGFMKDICHKYNIPTAKYARFSNAKDAKEYLAQQTLPIVIKADGLAAGKGVIIAQQREEAEQTVDEMFSGKFGSAGNEIIIEEFMQGEEISFFALCDGKTAVEFGSAQDHKAVGDGDTGPNTGGMGAYTPAPIATPDLRAHIMQEIIFPTLKAMQQEGMPYEGVLFAGLMITKSGPRLIEFNCRFGDPETQSLMMLLDDDLAEILFEAAKGKLLTRPVKFHSGAALCVVMAAEGYPGEYVKNTEIKGLNEAAKVTDVEIFHAGTKASADKILAIGGRVLGVTAFGKDVKTAQALAYQAVDKIDWQAGFCRRDIGWRAIEV